MADREKVIKGLYEAQNIIQDHVPVRYVGYSEQAIWDALALLKEQEAVEPLRPRARGRVERFWVCGECGAEIDKGDRFCRYCGRETKWED